MSDEARKLLVKIYSYRVTGVIFTVVGLVYFAAIYTQVANGSFLRLLERPVLMLWLIAPFIPSSLLFWMQGRVEKKLRTLLEQSDKTS